MRIYAAVVPPRPVLDDLAAAVRSVDGTAVELDPVPVELMHLPLAGFGNVGLTDRMALLSALRQEAACWAPVTLHFHGGSALVEEGDDSIWAELDGDLEQLTAIATVMPRVVHRLGFLIDRRSFRTRVRVARSNPATSIEVLESVLARLDSYQGPAWTAHEALLLRRRSGDETTTAALDLLHHLPLTGRFESADNAGYASGRHRATDVATACDGQVEVA
jgi:RNA 2',3'-cyclic 3'-phosphodiesterase